MIKRFRGSNDESTDIIGLLLGKVLNVSSKDADKHAILASVFGILLLL